MPRIIHTVAVGIVTLGLAACVAADEPTGWDDAVVVRPGEDPDVGLPRFRIVPRAEDRERHRVERGATDTTGVVAGIADANPTAGAPAEVATTTTPATTRPTGTSRQVGGGTPELVLFPPTGPALPMDLEPRGPVGNPGNPSPTFGGGPLDGVPPPAGCAEYPPFSPFIPDPQYGSTYDPQAEIALYDNGTNQCGQRPLIEWGRGLYRSGVVPKSFNFLGDYNLIAPGFTLFGDFRTAVAVNDNGVGDPQFVWANRLNLDFDFKLTATERIHAFWGPLDEGNRFTRVVSLTDGRDELRFFEEFDDDFDTLFFEGDLGYIWGGMTDQWAPFDLPFVAGKFPLLFQNGVWMNDAIEGFAFTIPARNCAALDISNYEITWFFGFDDIDSPAFAGDDNAADVYGTNAFIETLGGYFEIGHAFLNDRTGADRDYHNLTVAFTRRYFQRISNSVRVLLNFGQDPAVGPRTADGQLVLIENALVSHNPNFYVPYLNLFAGWGTPQSVARQGGVLLNTGINFETDLLTGFPRLDDRGNDTWGGAFGFNLLGPNFSWQWILEAAMVQTFDGSLAGDEYGVGTRFQLPINYAWLVRLDGMYGLRENQADISGVRAELRWKF